MAVTVRDIYDHIDAKAPFCTQDGFDNSGLLVGDMNAEVTKVLVCLDINNLTAKEAADKGANLIVSHHPVIFNKLSAIEPCNPVNILIKNGISAICAHTNVDIAKGGSISDVMLELLGFGGETEVFEPIHSDGSGYGRIINLFDAVNADYLANLCKTAFGCHFIKYYDCKRPIKRLAVSSGAGGSETDVANAVRKGCDALITGQVKHSGFMEAVNRNITLIDAGHFHTENIICPVIAEDIKTEFKVETFVAEKSCDLLSYC